jgi:hypothetical protein
MKQTNGKNIIVTMLLFSFSWISSTGQNIETHVKEIKAEYERIVKDSAKYKVVEKDIFGESAEGGTLKKYYDDTVLRKAILILYGETGKSISEYYFLKGKLIFEFDTEIIYEPPINMEKIVIKSREEHRFYFYDQKLIQWITGNKMVDVALHDDKEDELLEGLKIVLAK